MTIKFDHGEVNRGVTLDQVVIAEERNRDGLYGIESDSRRKENDDCREIVRERVEVSHVIQDGDDIAVAENYSESCSRNRCIICGLMMGLLFLFYGSAIVLLTIGIKSNQFILVIIGSSVLTTAITTTIKISYNRYQDVKDKRNNQNSSAPRQVSPRRIEPLIISRNRINSRVDLSQVNCQLDNNLESFSSNSQNRHLGDSLVNQQIHQVFQSQEPPSYQEILPQLDMTERKETSLFPPSYEDAICININ